MTLIISCATKDFAVQVSDRRLTWLGGDRNGQLIDDDANKALVIEGNTAFAYTGVANIGSEKTDDWLRRIIVDGIQNEKRLSRIIEKIRQRATQRFAFLNCSPAIKRHAFVAIGWTLPGGPGPWVPAVCVISNALDENWRWLPAAKPEFQLSVQRLPEPDGAILTHHGFQLPDKFWTRFARSIWRAIDHDCGPDSLARLMSQGIYEAADLSPTVGRNLMVVSSSREAVERSIASGQHWITAARPHRSSCSFWYVSPGRRNGVPFSPIYVFGTGAVMRGFSATYRDRGPA